MVKQTLTQTVGHGDRPVSIDTDKWAVKVPVGPVVSLHASVHGSRAHAVRLQRVGGVLSVVGQVDTQRVAYKSSCRFKPKIDYTEAEA